MIGLMIVAFGLLMRWCLEWIVVEYNQLVCWDVVMVLAYGLDRIARSFVVDTDL